MSIIIRKPKEEEYQAIESIIDELALGHSSIDYSDFLVAISGGEIAGVVNLKDCGPCVYLNAVGVKKNHQGKGIAKELIRTAIKNSTKEIYLYTKICDFFSKFGFKESAPHPSIPSREIYGCNSCSDLHRCVCMVRL